MIAGAAMLVVARIFHAIGMAGPVALRATGAMATYLVLGVGSIYGLVLAFPHLST